MALDHEYKIRKKVFTMKTLVVLFLWANAGHGEVMALDHFDTMAECQAVIDGLANQYLNGNYKNQIKNKMDCYIITVPE